MSGTRDQYRPVIRELAAEVRAAQGGAAALQVLRAYQAAVEVHRGEFRKDGSPYISHCVAVARIVGSIESDATLVCAALLHDVTDCSVGPAVLRAFDAAVVAVVTACAEADRDPERAAVSDIDPAVLTIKLADRLHNLRTISALRREKQLLKAEQSRRVLVPLADAIGSPLSRPLSAAARAVELSSGSAGGSAQSHEQNYALLNIAASMLPPGARDRWLLEWRGELSALRTRRAKWKFTWEVLWAAPFMAIGTRRQAAS